MSKKWSWSGQSCFRGPGSRQRWECCCSQVQTDDSRTVRCATKIKLFQTDEVTFKFLKLVAMEWKVTIFTKNHQTQLMCLVPSVLLSLCSSAISLSEVCFNNPRWHSPVSAVGVILFNSCLYVVVEKQRKMLYHDKSDILKFSDRDSAQKFIWSWLNSADR